MSRTRKFFVISGAGLEYREIRHLAKKVLGTGLLAFLVVFALVWGINRLLGDPLGFGRDELSIVTAENRMLKDQLRDLSSRMQTVQNNLDRIAERGNELRLMVDLKRIDEETRLAPAGGTVRNAESAFLSGEAESILRNARNVMDQLGREVRLQQSSYEDIYRRYEYNQSLFAHLPAIKPMEGYYSVNGFGMRIHPVLRVYRMHEGLDIINDVGTKVYASGDGQVLYSGRTQGGYGTVIEISHGYGYSSLYAHLSSVLVRPGQTVRRGELIGRSGRSGLVSGPHLHYEVRLNGRKQNPVDYFFDDIEAARYRMLLADTR
jgi:murein DD-endopeptidase MepM/ murein hydrolase activator NlpD